MAIYVQLLAVRDFVIGIQFIFNLKKTYSFYRRSIQYTNSWWRSLHVLRVSSFTEITNANALPPPPAPASTPKTTRRHPQPSSGISNRNRVLRRVWTEVTQVYSPGTENFVNSDRMSPIHTHTCCRDDATRRH